MSGNNITQIKFNENNRIEAWHQLRSLNLADNKLTELPIIISELDELMQFNISRNRQLRALPNELGLLKNLFSFKIEGLDLLRIPKNLRPVNGKNPRALMEFLSQRLVKQVTHSFMKVFVVGGARSGKTSIAKGIDADPSREPESIGTGLEVRSCKLSHINISLWEFDGHDELYSTQPYFMSERAVYIVVYNTNDSEVNRLTNIKVWLQKIKARAPKAPVLLVGTHRDLLPESHIEGFRFNWDRKVETLR